MDAGLIRSRKRRWVVVILGVLVLVLIAARLALPGWVAGYLNGKLDHMGQYHGRLADVDLHLWRGAYSINDLSIVKRGGDVPVPLLKAPRIDLSVSWKALFRGAVVATADFDNPEINIVGRGHDLDQSGAGVDWREQLEGLLPIRLNEVNIHNGVMHFRNFTSEPKVDLVADQVEGSVHNLTNVSGAKQGRVADMNLTARMFGEAPLESSAQFDPLGTLRNFKFKLKVTKVDLTRLNDFLQAYVYLDVESGNGDFVMQLEAHDGKLDGYAKPLFRDVDIFSFRHDVVEQHDNPLRAAWEAVAGGIQNLFKNQSKKQFATRVEIHGEVGDSQTSTWQAIMSILHNAFVNAYRPQFEHLPKGSVPASPDKG